MTDERRDSHDDMLDARIRTAAAALAEEALPDGVLDMAAPAAPAWHRLAPFALAAAAVAGIAVWIGLTQVGPPNVADTSPSPSASAPPRVSPSEAPTTPPGPSPTLEESPAPTPVAVQLVSAGALCGNGELGYAFAVPVGWYANRAWGDTAPCTLVANEPFDVPYTDDDSFAAPITLVPRVSNIPPGDAVEVDNAVRTAIDGWLATRYAVERDGMSLAVFVMPVYTTTEGAPGYVHLEAVESDNIAVGAIERLLVSMIAGEPLVTPVDAITQAHFLYEEPDVDGCINVEFGIVTAFPEAWWTNTPVDGVPGCVYLAPTSFEIPDDPSEVPDGVAITIRRVDGSSGSGSEEITGYDSIVVDGRWPATRLEWGDSTYQYVVQLGPSEESGPNLILTTGADPLHRAVLDRVASTIRISPPPAEVVNRDPLTSCGVEIVRSLDFVGRNPEARECFADAYAAGEPAEFIIVSVTLEGAPNLSIWRVLGPESVELYSDPTHDMGGGTSWTLYQCASIDVSDDAEGTPYFGLGACDHEIRLDASP